MPHSRAQNPSPTTTSQSSKPTLKRKSTESTDEKVKRLTINAALDKIQDGLGRYDWASAARPEQCAPASDDWTTWLFIGGRGAGKTRAGAEWVRAQVRKRDRENAANGADNDTRAPMRIALIAETYADAREVMVEGPSGLRAVAPPHDRPSYMAARRRLEWPGGAIAYCFSAEDPDGLRGYQFDIAWGDELCKWRYP